MGLRFLPLAFGASLLEAPVNVKETACLIHEKPHYLREIPDFEKGKIKQTSFPINNQQHCVPSPLTEMYV